MSDIVNCKLLYNDAYNYVIVEHQGNGNLGAKPWHYIILIYDLKDASNF